MGETVWSVGPTDGELRIRTGVAGPAAKMGHRLTIAMQSWEATASWRGSTPTSAALTVDVDSLEVLKGSGGVTPLTPPERLLARANACKSLDAKKYPRITFTADDISRTPLGYRLAGTLEIHGTSRPQTVELTFEDRGTEWAMSTEVEVVQSDFGVKPYSLMMGTLKVADAVTVSLRARHPK